MLLTRSMLMSSATRTPGWRFDSAAKAANITLSGSDRSMADVTADPGSARGTVQKTSGKWYTELYIGASTGTPAVGVVTSSFAVAGLIGSGTGSIGYLASGDVNLNGFLQGSFSTFTSGDTIGVAFDRTAGKVWFSKNGAWISGDPNTSSGGFTFTGDYVAAAFNTNSAGGVITVPTSLRYSTPAGFANL